MSPDLLFSIVNAIAMVGWLGLILLPKVRWGGRVLSIAVAALLSVAYVALIAVALPQSEGGFSSLSGVSALFGNRWALLAGWTHYLAFDLLVGGWEAGDAHSRGIPHLLVVPALILTLLFGPAGFLLYLAIRTLIRPAAGDSPLIRVDSGDSPPRRME